MFTGIVSVLYLIVISAAINYRRTFIRINVT